MKVDVQRIEWSKSGKHPDFLQIEIFPKDGDIKWEVENYFEKNYGQRPLFFEIRIVK